MEKEQKDAIIKRLLVKGINQEYSRISSDSIDMQEFIQAIVLEPNILNFSDNINSHIVKALLFHYRKEICSFLKKNIKKIENERNLSNK